MLDICSPEYAEKTQQAPYYECMERGNGMNLMHAQEGAEYIIKGIGADDEEMEAFLFSLGCYAGEPITVVSRRKGTCVVSIKDGRYSIDNQLAEAIEI